MIARTRQMIPSLLSSATGTVERRLEHDDLHWLDIVKPSAEHITNLRTGYSFHPLHLEDVVSHLQRPKIDDDFEEEYVFLVLHFPVYDATNRTSVVSEVDIFAGRNYIITLHDGKLKPLVRLVHSVNDEHIRKQLMGRGSGYLLYRVIETLVSYCFPMVDKLDAHVDRIEETIFNLKAQNMVEDISFLRRDIIATRRIIRPNVAVVRSLEVRERTFLHVDEEVYFGDLTDGLNKLWDMLEEQKEMIEGLNATLDSLTSHRINKEMKVFTLISVIMLPMTLVASILGMNVVLPFADHTWSLPASLALMILVGYGMYVYLRYRHWI